MFSTILVETAKLRNSLALLLCTAAPLMVAILTGLVAIERKEPTSWSMFTANQGAVWAIFMLPLTVTALTVLLAQIEHGPRFWNHLLSLPIPRWRIYAAKAIVTILLVGLMSLALVGLLPLSGQIAEWVAPGRQLTGAPDLAADAERLGDMFRGSLLLISLQLWAALRFRSFVPPLVLGIGGTLVGIVASGSERGIYFPWLMPASVLASDPARAELAINLGFWGGLIALALMILDLGRRDVA